MDYETNRTLNDVGVFLTLDEAEEMLAYLRRLKEVPGVQHVTLSELANCTLAREITLAIAEPAHQRVTLA